MTLTALQKRIGHSFDDPELLSLALAHRSVGRANNERLEFLGDAMLGYAVAAALFDRYPAASEADLTLMRIDLVRKETLASIAREIDLGASLSLGQGERKSGGWNRDSILADALEALIGAVLRDGGAAAAGGVIERLFAERLVSVKARVEKDPKTRLQEELQARKLALPVYAVVGQSGRDHAKVYDVECRVESMGHVTVGRGASRRDAEKEAAEMMLEVLDAPADDVPAE